MSRSDFKEAFPGGGSLRDFLASRYSSLVFRNPVSEVVEGAAPKHFVRGVPVPLELIHLPEALVGEPDAVVPGVEVVGPPPEMGKFCPAGVVYDGQLVLSWRREREGFQYRAHDDAGE